MLISLPIIVALESCEYLGRTRLCPTPASMMFSPSAFCHIGVTPEGSTVLENGMVIDDDNEKPDASRG